MSELSTEQLAAPEKPCLVETGRGFSVSYKNRFLYSKYDPKKSVLQTISNMEILSGTLILAFSPALWYGIEELLEKLPENCLILGIETDSNLWEFSKEKLEALPESIKNKILLFPQSKIMKIVEIISGTEKLSDFEFPSIANFKRARMIEMSGGVNLNRDFYMEINRVLEDAVSRFWKNRITLTKLGKLYSKNIFKNLSVLKKETTSTVQKYYGMISKPIFVFGAGESAEISLKKIPSSVFKKFFVLCVDAATPLLKSKGIIPDGIVAVEGQLAIEKAYIGGGAKNSVIFADLTSRMEVTNHSEKVSFFVTDFMQAKFLDSMKEVGFLPPQVPPLGSVGLTAVFLALKMRSNENIPIFVSGLDFSFSIGKTHAKETPHEIQRLCISDRLNPLGSYGSSFGAFSQKFVSKNGKVFVTEKSLFSYATQFSETFRNEKNLFDGGESGINLGLPIISSKEIVDFAGKIQVSSTTVFEKTKNFRKEIDAFLEGEEKALNRLKELLMFGKDVESCSVNLETEIENLLSEREYLFLHFPDGFRCNSKDLSFLKRVRGEIDFFLKMIRTGI